MTVLALVLAACGDAGDRSSQAQDRVTLEALLGAERSGPDGTGEATDPEHEAALEGPEAAGRLGSEAEPRAGEQVSAETARDAGSGPPSEGPTEEATGVGTVVDDDRRMGPGVTEDTITVGFQFSPEIGEALAAFGYGGDDADAPGEDQAILALVDWVNDTGGLAGRELVPVLHSTDQLSGTFASQAQAACSTFTEDNEVFAAGTTGIAGSQHLIACMAERGTPLVEHTFYPFDSSYYERYEGWLYTPGRMRPERALLAAVDGLAQQGFYDDATLGLVRYDATLFARTTEEVLKPRLAEHGVEVEEEVELATPASAADVGGMAAEINNAILRLRAAGVTHVMFWEYPGAAPFLFLPQAESQGYRPAYGLMTYSSPLVIAENSPEAQLEQAVGVGWATSADVTDAQHPGGISSWGRCREILDAAGVDMTYPRTSYYVQPHCDTVFFLRAALERAPDLTASGLHAAVGELGTDYLSPQTLGTRLGPGRVDGASAYRPFAYDPSVGGFAYTGQARQAR